MPSCLPIFIFSLFLSQSNMRLMSVSIIFFFFGVHPSLAAPAAAVWFWARRSGLLPSLSALRRCGWRCAGNVRPATRLARGSAGVGGPPRRCLVGLRPHFRSALAPRQRRVADSCCPPRQRRHLSLFRVGGPGGGGEPRARARGLKKD